MIRAVVFDLDGTLANTAGLTNRRREPSMLLGGGVDAFGNEAGPRPWSFGQHVNDLPAVLIERGYRVAIVTKAPLAYALTLVHLLQIDYEVLRASGESGTSKVEALSSYADELHIEPKEMLYCGDLEEDALIARDVGCDFMSADNLRSAGVLEHFPSMVQKPSDGDPDWPLNTEPTPAEITDLNSAADAYLLLPTRWHRGALGLVDRYLELCESTPVTGAVDEESEVIASWRAAMAMAMLWRYPMIPQRRRLQLELFRTISEVDRDVLTWAWEENQRFGICPRYVSRRELRDDKPLRREYFHALERVWPTRPGGRVENLAAAAAFDGDGEFGRVLVATKHYSGHKSNDRLRSGSNVQLQSIDFIAELIACRVDPNHRRPLVPVPSSEYTPAQPGQISTRIARKVADLAERPLLPLLRRREDDYEVDTTILRHWKGRRVVDLVDDQVTTGGTIEECSRALSRSGVSVDKVYAFSANRRVLAPVSRQAVETWRERDQAIRERQWGH